MKRTADHEKHVEHACNPETQGDDVVPGRLAPGAEIAEVEARAMAAWGVINYLRGRWGDDADGAIKAARMAWERVSFRVFDKWVTAAAEHLGSNDSTFGAVAFWAAATDRMEHSVVKLLDLWQKMTDHERQPFELAAQAADEAGDTWAKLHAERWGTAATPEGTLDA